MKFLLCAVNSKYIHSNPAVYMLKAYADVYLDRSGPDIEIAEFTINNYSDEVLADIFEKKPDVLFFSCYIWNWEFVQDLIPDIRKVLPCCDIWLGGPEVSYDAKNILSSHRFVMGIITGEGEKTFTELIGDYYITRRKDLPDICGICFRSQNKICFTKKRDLIQMDEIPFLYNEDNISRFDNRIIYYESSRGCPFSCSYCLSSREKVRYRSLENVFKELDFFLNHNVRQVKFTDRTFNADPQRCRRILEYLLEHDNGITNFHFEIEGNLLSDQEIAALAKMRPGLVQLEIGVQSANSVTLGAVRRNPDLSVIRSGVRKIKSIQNVHIHLDLIAGLPYEDYESFAKSFNEVYSMQPSQLQLGFLKVLKGSPMESDAPAYGIVYKAKAPYEVLYTNWISYEQILMLKRIEQMVELYYNSNQFTMTLAVLEREFRNPFDMFEKLADFYDQKGYFTNSPARIYRYQVLLDFAAHYAPEKKDLYAELLTFDLYFRENLKSEPPFAPDQKAYKKLVRSLEIDRSMRVQVFRYPVHLAGTPAFMQSVKSEHQSLELDDLYAGKADSDKSFSEEISVDRNKSVLYIIVFDYSKRDPIDNNAAFKVIEALAF